MALWHVFLDESGDKNSDMFAVGGYLIEAGCARELEAQWLPLLAAHNLPFFHMVDAAHGNDHFKGIEKQDIAELAKRLIQLIHGHATQGVVVITNPQRYPIDDLYTELIGFLVGRFGQIVRDSDGDDAGLAIFVEAGHASRTVAETAFASRLHKLGLKTPPSLTFASKSQVTLLQAADIFCWQATKYTKDLVTNARPTRRDFLELMKLPHDLMYVSKDNDLQGTTNILRDAQPGPLMHEWKREPRDKYVRALFSFGAEADRTMKAMHDFFDDRQNGPRWSPGQMIEQQLFGYNWLDPKTEDQPLIAYWPTAVKLTHEGDLRYSATIKRMRKGPLWRGFRR